MTDHDPGDEDRRDVITDSCPFCGVKLHHLRIWKTPVFPPMPFGSFSEAAAIPTLEKWFAEVLTTCVDCKLLARRFADLQRATPQEKESRAYIRDYERRASLQP